MKNTILYTGLIALSSTGLFSCGKEVAEPAPGPALHAPVVLNNTRVYGPTILFDFTVTDDKTIDPSGVSVFVNRRRQTVTFTQNGDSYRAGASFSGGNYEVYAFVEDADGQRTTSDVVTVSVPFAN
jgi:hypothetical protein